MKRVITLLLLIAAFAGMYATGNAQWKQVNSPRKRILRSLISNGDFIFAVTDSSLFRKERNAVEWMPVYNESGYSTLNTLYVFNGMLFVGSESGIWRSLDNGDHWEQLDTAHQYSRNIMAFVAKDSVLFAAGEMFGGGALLRSTDSGASWTKVPISFYVPLNAQFALVGNVMLLGTNGYGSGGGGIYRSTNNGANWTNPLALTQINSICESGGEFFAGGLLGYHSVDSGRTWTQLDSGIFAFKSGYLFNSDDSTLFVWGKTGEYGSNFVEQSTDHGTTWSLVDTGNINFRACHNFALSQLPNKLRVSQDHGVTWQDAYDFTPFPVNAIEVLGNTIVAADMDIFTSSDSGANWVRHLRSSDEPIYYGHVIWSLASTGHIYFASTDVGLVRCHEDDGAWQEMSYPWLFPSYDSIQPLTFATMGTNVYMCSPKASFFSADTGANWILEDSAPPWTSSPCLLVSNGQVFAGTDHGVVKSTNNGATWSLTGIGSMDQKIHALTACGNFLYAAGDQATFRTRDSGATWEILSTLVNGGNISCLFSTDSTVFAGTDSGVLLRKNNSIGWSDAGTGLPPSTQVFALSIMNGDLYAGTNSGIWRRALSEMITSVGDHDREIPSIISLSRNYPNPFTTATTIEYIIPQSEFVTLRIFNAFGQEVKTLIESKQPAGIQAQTFQGDDLHSGIYFYRLTAGNQTHSEKMIVVH